MKEMNIQFHKTRPQNPFDDGAKARLHRMGLLRIDGSVDEATLDALSRAYSGLLFDDLCDTCQNSCEITEILRRLYEAAEQAEPRQKFLLICLQYQEPAYTSAKDMERKDGSIGTLKIPSLDINMKVWEGETKESMKKGLGHYSSTSAWDGNIGVCGHNRGAKYTIGSIKDLEIGDTITYTTIYGTRTYEVVLVKTISNSDWSYLQATADNRITLTTCLANQPEKRICVQAVQITQ